MHAYAKLQPNRGMKTCVLCIYLFWACWPFLFIIAKLIIFFFMILKIIMLIVCDHCTYLIWIMYTQLTLFINVVVELIYLLPLCLWNEGQITCGQRTYSQEKLKRLNYRLLHLNLETKCSSTTKIYAYHAASKFVYTIYRINTRDMYY